MIQVTASVEVEERREGSGLGKVALGLGIANALESCVQTGDIGLVVLGVVELHDLARDVRLEGAIVVCGRSVVVSSDHVLLSNPRFVAERTTYMEYQGVWPCRGRTECLPWPSQALRHQLAGRRGRQESIAGG